MSETKGAKETKKTSKTAKKENAEETVKTAKKATKAAKETKLAEVMVAADGKKATSKKTTTKKTTAKKETAEVKPEKKTIAKKVVKKVEDTAAKEEVKKETKPKAKAVKKTVKAEKPAVEVKVEEVKVEEVYEDLGPRRSVAFIGSECYPFVKTGGLADVMYALPKELAKQNCDVKVILPRYKCIPWEYQEKMEYRGEFYMDLCADGRQFYVGIMEYVADGVVYDFIDNEEFFSAGNPYISMIDDIPKFCLFSKAALSALLYLDWIPDVIHCHDWQAALVPVYLRTLFENTALAGSKTIMTVHNLRFQGIYDIDTIKYWSGLPDYVFNKDALKVNYNDANMLKGGLTYADMITTVSETYAGEIQTEFYGEGLDAHLRYHSGKLRGIVNGIDCDIWNPATDERIYENYSVKDAVEKKKANKRALQEELGLNVDDNKFVIGLISRLTNQKGLDLVNTIVNDMIDGNTQLVVLGTGDPYYEDSFRYYEDAYRGEVCSNIMYDEDRAHRIYAGADALLVPSLFEPCGLTQLIAMRYGTVPIVRETGGLKDTVEPYNLFEDSGNGFTFDNYDPGLLLDAVNRAKTLYFVYRDSFDAMVKRDMEKDMTWSKSATAYRYLYLELKPE
ncbi:MAG: glycogen synthase [Erysipelotrichaceae bacterium]|nr:glycogen synthase [Erysipelotrichaceae bacterium]